MGLAKQQGSLKSKGPGQIQPETANGGGINPHPGFDTLDVAKALPQLGIAASKIYGFDVFGVQRIQHTEE